MIYLTKAHSKMLYCLACLHLGGKYEGKTRGKKKNGVKELAGLVKKRGKRNNNNAEHKRRKRNGFAK